MFNALPPPLNSAVPFVIVLGVLVFFHELGHYLAARWRGVHVETFSIGFGRALVSWIDRRSTTWKISLIPLGGYVRLNGMERPDEASPEARARWIPGHTFHEKSVLSRAIIIVAGPLANFGLAVVLFFALDVAVGRPVIEPVVGDVVEGSAAAAAGLKPGDRVTGIDAEAVRRFEDLQRIVSAHAEQKITLHIDRNDAPLDVDVTPQARDGGGGSKIGVLGVRGGRQIYEPMTLSESVVGGVVQTWDVTVQTLEGVWMMLTSRKGGEDLGGPLRIAQMSGEVAQHGFANLVSFIAVLSVNLGLINLFPIPVLDGGHLMFFLAEALRGRPLPVRAQEYGFRAGFALLIGLFVFATWNDLAHIGLFRWVAGLIG